MVSTVLECATISYQSYKVRDIRALVGEGIECVQALGERDKDLVLMCHQTFASRASLGSSSLSIVCPVVPFWQNSLCRSSHTNQASS